MKRIALFVLLLATFGHATTNVTGKIQTLGTGNITSGAFARFWLRGCAGNQPRVAGVSVIGPSQGGVFFFDISADSGGNVIGMIYSTRDATGALAGDIECGGSKLSVWYGLQIFTAGKGGPEIPVHAKSGGALDISSVTPITTNPVVTAPTGDTTYLRLDAGNVPFLGNLTPNGNGLLSLGASGNRWKLFGSSLDVAGASAFNGTFTVTGNSFFTIDGSGNATIGAGLTVPTVIGVQNQNLVLIGPSSPAGVGETFGGVILQGGSAGVVGFPSIRNGFDAVCQGGGGGGSGSPGNCVLQGGTGGIGGGDVVINGGISGNAGTGFKHKRSTAGCATAASIGATCTTVVTWGTAFSDPLYTAQCGGRLVTSGVPVNGGITVQVAASITFQTVATTAAPAQFTNIDCIAVHD